MNFNHEIFHSSIICSRLFLYRIRVLLQVIHMYINNDTLNLDTPVNLSDMLLDCGSNLEDLERTAEAWENMRPAWTPTRGLM